MASRGRERISREVESASHCAIESEAFNMDPRHKSKDATQRRDYAVRSISFCHFDYHSAACMSETERTRRKRAERKRERGSEK
jgi:hypothetical protein